MNRLLLAVFLGLTLSTAAFGGGTYTWPAPPQPTDSNTNPSTVVNFPLAYWFGHFEQLLQNSRKMDSVDLVFDGDTYAITGNPKGDHGGMWGPRYAHINAFEFGSAGDPTQTILWRLQNGQMDGLHPKLIVLLAGAANLQTNTPQEIADAIKAIVAEYQKRCPDATILLQGIFPRQELPTHPQRIKIKAVNQLLSALGDGKKVIFLDFSDKFLKPDGTMTKEMFYDFAFPRPSPEAYKIWAAAIAPTLDQFFPPTGLKDVSAPVSSPAQATSSDTTSNSPLIGGGTITWPAPPVPTGSNSAAIPEPPLGWLNQFQKKIDDSRKMPQLNVIFDGDSITAGWMGGGGGVWGHNIAKRHAFDFGNSGDTTNGILWQLANGQVDGLHPKLIVLLIGTNNLGHGTAEQLAAGIKAVVDAYQQHCPGSPILLQGIMPRGEQPTDPIRAKIKAINKILATYADGKNVIFLDWGDKLLTPEGLYTHPITGDFLHPNPPGYQIWYDAIKPILDQYCPLPPPSTPAAKAPAPAAPVTAPPAATTTSSAPATP